jgi:hypothetical protein
MKTTTIILTTFIILTLIIITTNTLPTSSEGDDWTDDILKIIRDCKKCTKIEVFEKIHKMIDDSMKDVKSGSLSHDECDRDVAEVVNMLNKDDAINATDFKEFMKGLHVKFEDKFAKTTRSE